MLVREKSPFLALALGILVTACDTPETSLKEAYLDLPATPYEYRTFVDGPEDLNAKATLGRVLFYDRQLSINNSIACASCHQQENAFSDNRRFSMGFEGKFTTRNSMPIQNLANSSIIAFMKSDSGSTSEPVFNGVTFPGGDRFAFGTHLFWDGRETSVSKLVLMPIGNHIEMGIKDVNALAEKLSKLPYYTPLFKEAFASETIDADKISEALTTFISAINSNNTRLDRANRGELKLTPLELQGQQLFFTKYDCNSCHQVGFPSGYIFAGTFANIGLDAEYQDPGLEKTTGLRMDNGKFKIPSLRNVSRTAPYMHDGRFSTLDEVMEHYSSGIADNENLDARLKGSDGRAKEMNISASEREAIIAFLHTLTDESVLQDPKFSNPFKLKQ